MKRSVFVCDGKSEKKNKNYLWEGFGITIFRYKKDITQSHLIRIIYNFSQPHLIRMIYNFSQFLSSSE